MKNESRLAFLFDVDNTLLDNDTVIEHLRQHLDREFGEANRRLYFEIFEQLRSELGYADYLGALERYRLQRMHDPRLLRMSSYLINYPFPQRIYPRAVEVVTRCALYGATVILSDGDAVFQPLKVERSGLWNAFHGNVLIYIHKEHELDDVTRLYPARHYVLIDDKVRILDAVKRAWGERVTTVFPKQGHYALDDAAVAKYPSPDVTVESIADLLEYDWQALDKRLRA